jgi:hypothetical protein
MNVSDEINDLDENVSVKIEPTKSYIINWGVGLILI